MNNEVRIHLTGWKALVVLVLVAVIIVSVVFNRWGQPVKDPAVRSALVSYLKARELAGLSKEAMQRLDGGDRAGAEKVGEEIAGLEIELVSVRGAWALIDSFRRRRDMVLDTTYRVVREGQPGPDRSGYYLLRSAPFSDAWFCHGRVPRLWYYLNLADDDG